MTNTIVVCTPTVDGKYEHGMELSLATAMIDLRQKGWVTIRDHPRGSNIGVLRDIGVKHAIDANADYLLQVDSDTVIPSNMPDVISKMIARDVDIVSGVYVGKQGDYVPIAAKFDGDHYQTFVDIPTDGSMVEVDAVGGGFVLIKTEVFRQMTKPYFHWLTGYPASKDTPFSLRGCRNEKLLQRIKSAAGQVEAWMEENKKGLVDVPFSVLREFLMVAPYAYTGVQHGEDYGFCRKAKAAGFKIWLDTSVQLGHIGQYIYTLNDFLANRAYKESLHGHQETHNAGIIQASV